MRPIYIYNQKFSRSNDAISFLINFSTSCKDFGHQLNSQEELDIYAGKYTDFRDFLDVMKLDMAFHAHSDRVDASTPPVSPSATAIPVAERQEAPPPPPPPPNAIVGTHQPKPNATAPSHVKESDETDPSTKSLQTSARLWQRMGAGDSPDPVMTNNTLNSESDNED